METRNIIAAISLSAAVIILYSLFFAPPPIKKENITDKNKIEQNSDAPSLDQKENVAEISREEALSQSERITFENQSIFGSISLNLPFKIISEMLCTIVPSTAALEVVPGCSAHFFGEAGQTLHLE